MKTRLKSTLFSGLLVACLVSFPWLNASAETMAIQENTHYRVISSQAVVPNAQVEVVEFFSYACPHCAHLEPFLQAWKKTLSPSVKFRRVPVVFRPDWESFAKVYYTLDLMGLSSLESLVFKAVHEENQNLADRAIFMAWLAKQKIDVKKAQSVYDSFSINTKLMKGKALTQQYRVEGVPLLLVGGRYITDVQMAGSAEKIGLVLNHLIALSQKTTATRK